MRTLLCPMAIIKNENKKTIIKILEYLKLKYNFSPELMTFDLGKGPYIAVKFFYPNCRIFSCFYHMMYRE